jgi:hypothetical protein
MKAAVDTHVTHRRVHANGVSIHIAEPGTGPLVLLARGFLELWYSWRRQLPVLAGVGAPSGGARLARLRRHRHQMHRKQFAAQVFSR